MPARHVVVERVGVVIQPCDDDTRSGESRVEIGVTIRDVHARDAR